MTEIVQNAGSDHDAVQRIPVSRDEVARELGGRSSVLGPYADLREGGL